MDIKKETINKLVMGDQRAFHEIFRAAYPKIYAFVLGFIKDTDEAEDIVQTIFIKLWIKRERLAKVNNLNSYLYSISKNTILNHLASKKVFTLDIAQVKDLEANDTSVLHAIEAQDLQLLIDMIVENMPPQRQAIYRMSREEGLSNEEIAQRTGLQKKTVENHLNLALGDIRKMLKIFILLLTHWG